MRQGIAQDPGFGTDIGSSTYRNCVCATGREGRPECAVNAAHPTLPRSWRHRRARTEIAIASTAGRLRESDARIWQRLLHGMPAHREVCQLARSAARLAKKAILGSRRNRLAQKAYRAPQARLSLSRALLPPARPLQDRCPADLTPFLVAAGGLRPVPRLPRQNCRSPGPSKEPFNSIVGNFPIGASLLAAAPTLPTPLRCSLAGTSCSAPARRRFVRSRVPSPR